MKASFVTAFKCFALAISIAGGAACATSSQSPVAANTAGASRVVPPTSSDVTDVASSDASIDDSPAPGAPPEPQPTTGSRGDTHHCPLPFRDADTVLARVDTVEITACDVAIAMQRDVRDGLPTRPARAVLAALVDEALQAHEAIQRGLADDPAVRRRVRETLAAAAARLESAQQHRARAADLEHMRRYYNDHLSEFTTPERMHLREAVLASEQDAQRFMQDLATQSFEELVRTRTITPEGRRDEGDLGLVPASGNDRVSRAVATAGFALEHDGDVSPQPVRIEQQITEGTGRRQRTRTRVTFHIVQRIARLPEERVPFAYAITRILYRIHGNSFRAAVTNERAELLERLRRAHPPTIVSSALRRVRVAAAPTPPRATRNRSRVRSTHP